ncbi:hypothetical protein FOZ60_004066 [Perkinsus olseni]|uniref:Uncharacterized protein n=1 Tax=Perkinsus olseni TaxID=32597 RepID=A0A7J6PJ46_PEROL|nr:hypothetical protein FOZ60_004066 [Perkinsus olseni]
MSTLLAPLTPVWTRLRGTGGPQLAVQRSGIPEGSGEARELRMDNLFLTTTSDILICGRSGSLLNHAGGLAGPSITPPEEAEKFLLGHDRAQKILKEGWLNKSAHAIHKHFLQTQSGGVEASAGLRLPAFTKCLTGFLKLLPDVSSAKLLFRRVAGAGSQEVDVGGLGRAVLASASVTPYTQAAIKEWPSASRLMAEHPDMLLDVAVQSLYQRDFKDLQALRSRLHHYRWQLRGGGKLAGRRDLAELQGVVVRSGAVQVSIATEERHAPVETAAEDMDPAKPSTPPPEGPEVADAAAAEETHEEFRPRAGSDAADGVHITDSPAPIESPPAENQPASLAPDQSELQEPSAVESAEDGDETEVHSPDSLNQRATGRRR